LSESQLPTLSQVLALSREAQTCVLLTEIATTLSSLAHSRSGKFGLASSAPRSTDFAPRVSEDNLKIKRSDCLVWHHYDVIDVKVIGTIVKAEIQLRSVHRRSQAVEFDQHVVEIRLSGLIENNRPVPNNGEFIRSA